MNKKTFVSGTEYRLYDIFSGENKIIIPDLQRDYCWGGEVYKNDKEDIELVTGFVESLISLFYENKEGEFTLGLIYGYEEPQSHVHLCDGQQRITTLFLLLGILNRKTDGLFQKYLISDFELQDNDKEPYLQYAVRESTLYFLSDLVCNFFICKELKVCEIEKQDWYFNEYSLDASIVSMINALTLIENRLAKESNFDFVEFANFIIKNIQMLYYDMGNRAQGEETFVIINTTGEPLTATENMKPIFINNLPKAQQLNGGALWENWETYFWANRKNKKKESTKASNDIADKGLLEFFRWLVLLKTDEISVFEQMAKGSKPDILGFSPDEIQEYFEIVEFTFADVFPNNKYWLAPTDMNSQVDWFRILPVIEYIKRFGKDNKRGIERVKKFFRNMAKNTNVGKDIASMLPLAVRVIKELPSDDIADILLLENVSKILLTDEERLKFELYKSTNKRDSIESSFWKEEEHKVWDGEIMPILEWSTDEEFDFEEFKKYSKTFSILFHDQMDYEELDLTRRALLTRELSDYPRIFTGSTNYSFCWYDSDWKTLINDNRGKFQLFLSLLLEKDKESVHEELNKLISNNRKDKKFDEFVKIPELLSFCKEKNIQWAGEQGWILISGSKRSGHHANLKSYRLYLDLLKENFWDEERWKLDFYPSYDTCCYFDNIEKDIAIDMLFSQQKDGIDLYKLLLFKRKNREVGKNELHSIAEACNLSWRENVSSNYYRYESQLLGKEVITEEVQKMITILSNE